VFKKTNKQTKNPDCCDAVGTRKTKTSISEETEKPRKLLFSMLISFSSPYGGE